MTTAKSHIRTYVMDPSENVTGGSVTGWEVPDSFVAQEDIRVVGVSLTVQTEPADASLNADGAISVNAEITPHGNPQKPGCICKLTHYTRWTATLMYHDQPPEKVIMFPAGTGYDMDEGEVLNLVWRLEQAGAGDTSFFAVAVIYYIRR